MYELPALLARAAELGISSSVAHDIHAREGTEGLARCVATFERPGWREDDGPIAVARPKVVVETPVAVAGANETAVPVKKKNGKK